MRVRIVQRASVALLVAFGQTACGDGGGGRSNGVSIERISVSSDGTEGDDGSNELGFDISADGRWAVFSSDATNFVALGLDGPGSDLFLRDRELGTTTILTITSASLPSDGSSSTPSLSNDGTRVAFRSTSSNLASRNSPATDVLVLDIPSGLFDRATETTDGIGANDLSFTEHPVIAGDGSAVAYSTNARSLVPGDTDPVYDIVLRDLVLDSTHSVTSSLAGYADADSLRAAFSADGRYLAFDSDATNLIANDTNDRSDVFLLDRNGGPLTRISVAPDESPANSFCIEPSLSADGTVLAFASPSSNLVEGVLLPETFAYQIVIKDLSTGATELASVNHDEAGDESSGSPSISANGRFVAFTSTATNLDGGGGESNVFVFDRETGSVRRLSVATDGGVIDGHAFGARISADGRWVIFEGDAGNLVEGDTNGVSDTFVAHNPLAE